MAPGRANAGGSHRPGHRGRPGTIAMLPNVSTIQAVVASCFTFDAENGFQGRKRIVYDDLNFSTVHYVWQEQQRRGAELCVVEVEGRNPPADRGAPRSHRRAHPPRPDQPRPLPIERDVRREAGHRPRARDGGDGAPRLLPVGRDGAARAQGVERRHGVRGIGEVGVRRAGGGVPVRAAGRAGEAAADGDGLVLATPSLSRSTWARCATRATSGG